MTVHRNRTHHRPSVRRLTGGLGSMRWVSDCPSCGHYVTTTFWKAALIKALLHSEALR